MTALYHSAQIPTTSGIYRITCTPTGKFYIGSAVCLRIRWKDHRSDLRYNHHDNPKLQAAWNKYGEEAFIFDILELVLIPEMLTAREQYWLDKLKPIFNIAPTAGSTLGVKHSPETRAKMSASRIGRPGTNLGRKFSPEVCAKMSASQRGTSKGPCSPEKRAKLSALKKGISLDPEFQASSMKTLIVTSPDGIEYSIRGIKRFCREHDLHHFHLMQVARGEYSQHKGWKARFPEVDIE
jgi:group I intron endonuclease